MKRVLPLLLALLLLLTGCGKETAAIISETSTATSFAMTHTAYTGHRETTLAVCDSATATVTGDLTSKSGTQTVTISDETGNVFFTADGDSGASGFTVKLSGPAEYTIAVDLKDHTGSYSFTWEIIGAAVQETIPAETTATPMPTAETEQPETDVEQAPEPEQEQDPSPVSEEPDLAPEDLDWNGIFTEAAGETTLELWQADSTSYEFAFRRGEESLVGVARIDLETMTSAACTLGDTTVTFTWLDTATLTVTADGTVAALTLDPTGTYVFTEMN